MCYAYGDHNKWNNKYKEHIRVYRLPNNKTALVLFVADDWSPPSHNFTKIVDKGPSTARHDRHEHHKRIGGSLDRTKSESRDVEQA